MDEITKLGGEMKMTEISEIRLRVEGEEKTTKAFYFLFVMPKGEILEEYRGKVKSVVLNYLNKSENEGAYWEIEIRA